MKIKHKGRFAVAVVVSGVVLNAGIWYGARLFCAGIIALHNLFV